MSKSNNESSGLRLSPATIVRAPFQRADKKVKMTMRSVPDTLRIAATQLLERVRVGLDIPSRAEVMDLAARISNIADTLEDLEVRRSHDSKELEALKKSTQSGNSARSLKPIKAGGALAKVDKDSATGNSLAGVAASLRGRPKAKADFKAQPKPGAKKPAPKKATVKKATAKTVAPKKASKKTGSKAVTTKSAASKKKATAAKKKVSATKTSKAKAKPAARKAKSKKKSSK